MLSLAPVYGTLMYTDGYVCYLNAPTVFQKINNKYPGIAGYVWLCVCVFFLLRCLKESRVRETGGRKLEDVIVRRTFII